jgi:hypothetical protein
MTIDDPAPHGFSLKRWSQRKLEAARKASAPPPDAAAATPGAVAPPSDPDMAARRAGAASAPSPPSPTPATAAEGAAGPELPPVDSLTIDSDFSLFLGPEVDPATRLLALKKLFRDPRFNVMDGLDVYIDDYSIPDPLAPELARQLAHARYIFDPPRTRINEAGIVEDAPPEEAQIDARELPTERASAPPDGTLAPEGTVAAEAAASLPTGAAPDREAEPATDENKPHDGSEAPRR